MSRPEEVKLALVNKSMQAIWEISYSGMETEISREIYSKIISGVCQ